MAFDSKKFFSELQADIELNDEQKAAFDSVLTIVGDNDKLSKRFEETTLRQSDFSRQSRELQDKIGEVQSYRTKLETWEQDTRTAYDEERKKLSDVSPSGTLNDSTNPEGYVSTDVFKESMDQLQGNALEVMATLNDFSFDHFKRFEEKLDSKALFNYSIKESVSLKEAYNQMIAPKLEEQRKADVKALIERERQEAVDEFKSTNDFPAQYEQARPGNADILNQPVDERPAVGKEAAVLAWVDSRKKK